MYYGRGRGKKILPLHGIGIICKFQDTPTIFFINYPIFRNKQPIEV